MISMSCARFTSFYELFRLELELRAWIITVVLLFISGCFITHDFHRISLRMGECFPARHVGIDGCAREMVLIVVNNSTGLRYLCGTVSGAKRRIQLFPCGTQCKQAEVLYI